MWEPRLDYTALHTAVPWGFLWCTLWPPLPWTYDRKNERKKMYLDQV